MKKKPRSRRSQKDYPALDPKFNLKIRQDLIDYDYVSKLSDEEKRFLNAFTEEYVNANFNHKHKKLHRSKRLKKDCYDRNNSRNRDIMSRSVAGGKLEFMEDILKKDATSEED